MYCNRKKKIVELKKKIKKKAGEVNKIKQVAVKRISTTHGWPWEKDKLLL